MNKLYFSKIISENKLKNNFRNKNNFILIFKHFNLNYKF